jgi:Asp-tRNA(Asn)/Glu-tRNA(Gln) amidotransferase A subunit family amidase
MCIEFASILCLLLLQRVRAKVLAGFEKTLKDCDIIMTPATATVAPALQQSAAGSAVCLHVRFANSNVNSGAACLYGVSESCAGPCAARMHRSRRLYHALCLHGKISSHMLDHVQTAQQLLMCHLFLTEISAAAAAAAAGSYDVEAASSLARFTLASSLTGLPCIVMPAGRRMGAYEPAG